MRIQRPCARINANPCVWTPVFVPGTGLYRPAGLRESMLIYANLCVWARVFLPGTGLYRPAGLRESVLVLDSVR